MKRGFTSNNLALIQICLQIIYEVAGAKKNVCQVWSLMKSFFTKKWEFNVLKSFFTKIELK